MFAVLAIRELFLTVNFCRFTVYCSFSYGDYRLHCGVCIVIVHKRIYWIQIIMQITLVHQLRIIVAPSLNEIK